MATKKTIKFEVTAEIEYDKESGEQQAIASARQCLGAGTRGFGCGTESGMYAYRITEVLLKTESK
jgi:hypothetical protein